MIKDGRLAIVEVSFVFLEDMMKANFEALMSRYGYKSSLPGDAEILNAFVDPQVFYGDQKLKLVMWSSEFEAVTEGNAIPIIDVKLTRVEKLG